MRGYGVAVAVAMLGGCEHGYTPPPDVMADAPAPRRCGSASGSVTEIAAGQLFDMDATRLFIVNGPIVQAWSKIDGTITALRGGVGSGVHVMVDDVAFAPSPPAGDSIIATNLDDGAQWSVALERPEPILSMATGPTGKVFARTADTIQSFDPAATSASVTVTAAPMASIIGMTANADALVWVELDATGQHLKKQSLRGGAVVVLNDGVPTTSTWDALMGATTADVFLIEYGQYGWSLVRRSLTDGHLIATYDGVDWYEPAHAMTVDAAAVFWAPPTVHHPGPPMTCSGWPALRFQSLDGPGGMVDDSFGDRPLLADELHLYFSPGGTTGSCCCGNAVTCNDGSTSCSVDGVPGNPSPIVKCYTR